ncbi:cupin domain-containing protein [Microbacterium sp. C7(2022)]|uniref:cupin domain-containing protein n=1 Tax=Microbacterium sp. C7(2022) TaxID=2992759 RepID=UPI00237B311A|nr:cupin domain-containing protein [Microbacterium sp. C7(2022)]MDE0545994.1 cupin domain-containing protein [Microbacterium sp. C7(2022)]
MAEAPRVRRVVTGHDDRGHAVILIDDIAPNSFTSDVIPGFGAAVPWLSGHPVDHVSDGDPVGEGSPIPNFPRVGETVFRIAEFPPDAAYPSDAQDRIFDEIDGKAEAAEGAKHSNGRHFWFHRTDSLDYAIVLEGEITLLVDDGEATLRAGDVAIQRATSHAWSNRTDRIARVAFVLIGTEPVSADEIASRRRGIPAESKRL